MKNHLSMLLMGLTVVLVGYASSAVIIFQAAQLLGANQAQIASWFWALGIGMGLSTILLSYRYKVPVLTAWSTPGAAVLVVVSGEVTLAEAIGGFIVCSILLIVVGLTRWMEKLMSIVPSSLSAALLAGVLLQFVINIFKVAETQLLLVAILLLSYLVGRSYWSRFNIPVILGIALIWATSVSQIQWDLLTVQMAGPQWIQPIFSTHSIMSVGIPLFVVTLFCQNLPGFAVLRSHSYDVSSSPIITITGLVGVILAPFGGFTYNLAAITAAIAMGDDVHPDKQQRYKAAIWAGVFYILMGVLAVSVVQFLISLPEVIVICLAGIALLGTFGNSLALALKAPSDATILTFLITASGFSLFGVSSAFWGVLVGICIYHGPLMISKYKPARQS